MELGWIEQSREGNRLRRPRWQSGHLRYITELSRNLNSLTAGLTGTFTARLNIGGQIDSAHARGWVARIEEPTRSHVGVGSTARWGAIVAAGGLKQADVMGAGAGQADSASAAFVRGADGGGRAGRHAAAATGNTTARHGVRSWGLVGLRREVVQCLNAAVFCSGPYIPTSLGISLSPGFSSMFQFLTISIKNDLIT